ncbi:MAG: hypothetical protein ACPLW4_00170 [Nitrososphaeria archaeon]
MLMKKYFKLYSIRKPGHKSSEIISYALPFLSKSQFHDIVKELLDNGFHLSTLFPKPGIRIKDTIAFNWLTDKGNNLPPYSATLYLKNTRNHVKLYSDGKLLSTFPIESYITDFLKNVLNYKRIFRKYEIPKPIGQRFENNYFILNWLNDHLKIFLRSRFESQKNLWLANRKANKYYILEDELTVLIHLCKMFKPKKIECLFNFPVEKDSIPIIKPGCNLMFKAETSSHILLSLLEDLLLNYEFPIDLKKSKSFIIYEDSSIIFKKLNSELDFKGLSNMFKNLKNYCFDSFHIFRSYYEINV